MAVRTFFGTTVMSPAPAGRIMVGIAGLGLLASLVGTIIGWQLATDLGRGVGQSLDLTANVLVTVDESFGIAEESLAILTEGVTDAESAVSALGRSMAEGEESLTAATELTGGEVADALEGVEATLPTIQAAAETIDTTLGALSAFGLDYSPDRALGPSIGQLREDLSGLPEELREQAAQVERTAQELRTATEGTVATADSLAQLRERLDEASELIEQYALRSGEARVLIEEQRDSLAASTTRARFLVVALGLMFALSQFVPLYLGLSLLGSVVPVVTEP